MEETYRVFISYSHADRELVEKIVLLLKENGMDVLWDHNFSFGHGFTDQIKNFIAHAHVFMPVITEASSLRGWVHQEIGYAMALHIPIWPLTKDKLPGEMLWHLHAMALSDNMELLRKQLSKEEFQKFVNRHQRDSRPLFECAEQQEDRTLMMLEYSNNVLELDKSGHVRQKGGLSSFHIPDKQLSNQIWKDRYGVFYSEYRCKLQRQERQSLERHARLKGCSLIIDTNLKYDRYGPFSKIARLKIIMEFLESIPSETEVKVAFVKPDNPHREHHLTIVGDWFMAEAVYAKMDKGIRQTIFSRHAPSIRSRIETFDEEMIYLLSEAGIEPARSRLAAVSTIRSALQIEVDHLLNDKGQTPEIENKERIQWLEQLSDDLGEKSD